MTSERGDGPPFPHRTARDGFWDDPYPQLARSREATPVWRAPEGFYVVFRHADAYALARSVPAGKRHTDGQQPARFQTDEAMPGHFMLHQDPPAHTRLRRLVSRGFTPRAVGNLRPRIERLVDDLLDEVAGAGEMDAIAGLARPVPATMICEMMGVPLEDRDLFTEWTANATLGLLGKMATPEQARSSREAREAIGAYFARLVESRSKELGDDLLSTLIVAAEDGDRLSPVELLVQASGLLVAGFETTIGLIGNGIRALAMHPDELRRLHEDPDLAETAVEEFLRFDSPVMNFERVVWEDVTFSGVTIPANSAVFASIAAANRDPEAFPDPDRLDIARTPNEHLAFGGGVHFCLGAHLARLEAQIAIRKFAERFVDVKLESTQPVWSPSLFRVMARLPLRFTARW